MQFSHYPVMPDEVIGGLQLKDNGLYMDGTLGGGGHSELILTRCNSRLIGVDKDGDALMAAGERLKAYLNRITFINDDFKNVDRQLDKYAPDGLDGILLDLGVSSYQIDTPERGFSYMAKDAPLDMRMNREQYLTAFNVVNEYSEYDLAKVIYEYGEERFSRKIAANICKYRLTGSIRTCGQLAEIVEQSIPTKFRYTGGNPSKRTFQAIRIEVNGELSGLSEAIQRLALRLKTGGRICIISFHSLEDRIVKLAFRELEKDCICDKSAPICTCNKRRDVIILTSKPILPSEEELRQNKRSGSAKLRIAERV